MHSAKRPAYPSKPRMKFLVSSRNRPFHSAHLPKCGNEPTWYSPPASHASAMSLTSPRIGSLLIMLMTGGSPRASPTLMSLLSMPVPGWPSTVRFSQLELARVMMLARSNRKPSMWYSETQYRRQSTIIWRTTGGCSSSVFPHPE